MSITAELNFHDFRVINTPAHSLQRPAAPMSVEELTRGLARCDESVFQEFHTRYFDRLHQFLIVVARGDESQAAEALQETLIRVARNPRIFQDEAVFWYWLKAVARNAARDQGRRRSRYERMLERFGWQRISPESVQMEDSEANLSALLEESLSELSSEERMMVEGKYLEGLRTREISTNSGLTERAVETRLSRLRSQLRESLIRKLKGL